MTSVLANIFGKSPVMPLENHINIAYECAKQLNGFFEAVAKRNWEEARAIHEEIVRLEHSADDLKKEIRLRLPKSLFMPVPREDLLEMLLVQDKIANITRGVSGVSIARELQIPDDLVEEFLEFVKRCVDAAKQARKSVRELDELYTTGFRGAEVELVEAMIQKLDEIETDTDERQLQLQESLHRMEDTLTPVNAVFLYEVIREIGEIADMAERVGRRLEVLLSH